MTQYMLSVHMVEGAEMPAPEEIERIYADVDAVNEEIQAQGAWVFGGGLHPAEHGDRRQGRRTARSSRPTARSPRRRSSSAGSG